MAATLIARQATKAEGRGPDGEKIMRCIGAYTQYYIFPSAYYRIPHPPIQLKTYLHWYTLLIVVLFLIPFIWYLFGNLTAFSLDFTLLEKKWLQNLKSEWFLAFLENENICGNPKK